MALLKPNESQYVPDAGDALAGDPAPSDYGERAVQRAVDPTAQVGAGIPRYTDTDLRALALEHAVATRGPHDDGPGESVVSRADKYLKFLRGGA